MRGLLVALALAACDVASTDDAPPGTEDDLPCAAALDDPDNVVQVDRYLLNDMPHLYFRADCCDQFDVVHRQSDCAYVCAPTGGITGRGDKACPGFFDKALHLGQTWP